MTQLSPQSLPDDVAALKAIIAGHTETLQTRDAELYAQSLLIEKLKAQLVQMRRAQFGASAENLDQLELLIEAIDTDEAEYCAKTGIDPPLEDKEYPKRNPLPAHLGWEDVIHEPERQTAFIAVLPCVSLVRISESSWTKSPDALW